MTNGNDRLQRGRSNALAFVALLLVGVILAVGVWLVPALLLVWLGGD